MQRLNQDSLSATVANTTGVTVGAYNRNNVRAGIAHFGVGNFHRCHQAVYVDKLLSQGSLDWGIVGVSMRSANVRDKLAPQDFLYAEVTLSQDTLNNGTELRVIGSILNILVAPENPAAVIQQVADSNIKLVTTTITEKGYYLVSGRINEEDPDVVADNASLASPRTLYGYLAAAIIQRCKHGGAPLSILCCDNIQNGGEHLRTGVHMLLQQHDEACAEWAKKHVSFASSMVDRVSPATDESLNQLVRSVLELDDAWPVSAEPFSQWVIEDNFSGERPDFDKVGAVFTNDIAPFEQMKLRFLNAGHSIISVLGYLDNQPTVHQALEQPSILDFALIALHNNILPVATLPMGVSGKDYIDDVIRRFRNSALPYKVQQVNTDSSQKIQQRWFPGIDDALAQNSSTALLSFVVAAWVIYVERAMEADELNDPVRGDFLEAQQQGEDIVKQFLRIAGADRFNFYRSAPFMASVLSDYKVLQQTEITIALAQFLKRPEDTDYA